VPAIYRRPATPGFIPLFKTLSSDPQTWRDLAWLAVTAVIGFAGGLVMVTAAGLSVSYLSMPLWYWAVADPQAEYGLTTFGHHTVDTMGEALTMTAIGFALIPLVLVLARSFAKAHAGLAVRLLGPAEHQVVSDGGSSHA
jgi:multisubunit Na+/H+ antiporter MnhC subunit